MNKGRPAPTLETGRLRLRGWRREDFEPWYAVMREPAVHRYFGPEPIGQEECWRRMCGAVGNWQMNGFGGFAVEHKADGKLVGNIGLFTAFRDIEPQFGDEPEMGWIFATETHGTGMAFEAGSAVLQWAEATLPATPIWAIISEGNEPSFRLAARLGFKPLQMADYHGPTMVLQRPSW
ncbi:GNAT family N-acetyltransferase [Sphingomonas sp. LHG3406-1]|uniref:GNAT family N-acetyltransferase n=1 Tax=Sphingomonas sp. LHG3406-1 TaxID=2804617 RepID=UPI002618AE4F|nr:GNAT family N-acetyltransferase [Sphingomonas sp. LHG3406-1]